MWRLYILADASGGSGGGGNTIQNGSNKNISVWRRAGRKTKKENWKKSEGTTNNSKDFKQIEPNPIFT